MIPVESGIYRHYKGALYQVLGMAHDANDEERIVVVYIGLQLDAAHEGPRLAVRTLEDFQAQLHITNGSTCSEPASCHPDLMPRFDFLGHVFTRDMLH